MKWNRKYNYPSSVRALFNGRRLYDVGSEKLPSVTTILPATQSEEKKAGLERWRQSIGHKQAEIITRESAVRGSGMHDYLEKFILGKLNLDLLGDNTRERMMADEIIEKGLRNKLNVILGCEAVLHYPGLYAGSADLIAEDYEGTSAIIDFKQSNKPKREEYIHDYYLQCAAYAMAHNKVYGTNIAKAVILVCTKDNLFQRFIVDGEKFKNYQSEFLLRVEQYHSQKNN